MSVDSLSVSDNAEPIINPINCAFAFIINPMQIAFDLPFSIDTNLEIDNATLQERAQIKEALNRYVPIGTYNVFASYESNLPAPGNIGVVLPEDQWRYYVVRESGSSDRYMS